MGKPTDFSRFLPSFLTEYLPSLQNVTENTISSYCDGLRLLLTFCRDERGMKAERLQIKDFSAELIKGFLVWVMEERKCGISTRNQRLAAIHSFFRYVMSESPKDMLVCHEILQIPFSKKEKPLIKYLSADEMTSILNAPDTSTLKGHRDLTFLSLLYDTGARVSEIISLKVRDIRLENPAKVILYGKGRKFREVPLLTNTAAHLKQYLTEQRLNTPDKLDFPLFFNKQRKALSRAGAAYILKKYTNDADVSTHVSPHVLRHSKAMHLLDSGINIFYIKGLLGHEDVTTTEVYAKASIETKRDALEKYSLAVPSATPAWAVDTDTIDWLKSFGKG